MIAMFIFMHPAYFRSFWVALIKKPEVMRAPGLEPRGRGICCAAALDQFDQSRLTSAATSVEEEEEEVRGPKPVRYPPHGQSGVDGIIFLWRRRQRSKGEIYGKFTRRR
jgi:hypothetical protein